MNKLPDTPLLLSSTLGGPLVIFTCTPLRNALTLGSRDAGSSAKALYRKAFRGGLRAGWTGGAAPAIVACPQFFALGPIYHYLNNSAHDVLGVSQDTHSTTASLFAACGAGLTETFLTFGAQSRNAQMAYNKALVAHSSLDDLGKRAQIPLNRASQIWGAGAGAMTLRNTLTVAGVRALSPLLEARLPTEDAFAKLSAFQRSFFCDATAAAITCLVSSPINQTFNFLVTTPEAKSMPVGQRGQLISHYLNKQYFIPKPQTPFALSVDFGKPTPVQEYSWRINRIAVRDFAMRAAYVTTVSVMFVTLERTLVAWYHNSKPISTKAQECVVVAPSSMPSDVQVSLPVIGNYM